MKLFVNNKKIGKYILLFAVFSVLFAVIPYTDDDLRWGCSVGMRRLLSWFDGYGGRYLGYLIIMLLTKVYLAKILVQAAILTFLVYMMENISCTHGTEHISVLSLFFMPLWIFSQTIGWASGFANYITSVTFTLVYVHYVLKRLDGIESTTSIPAVFGYIVLGFANSLIVEHFSIYNICLGLFIVAYTFFKEKSIRIIEFGYLLSSVCGSIFMLSNSAYKNISNGNDFYRGINTTNITSVLLVRIGRILNRCYLCLPVIVTLLTIIIYLVWKEKRGHITGIWRKLADIGTFTVCFGNPIILLADMTREGNDSAKNIITLFVLVLVLISIIITVGIFSFYSGRFWQCTGILISVWIPVMPFLIISPMPDRCFFGSYVFWILLIYQLLELIPRKRDAVLMNRQLQKYFKVVSYLAIGFYICIYGSINKQDFIRRENIRIEAEKGEEEVIIKHLSNENFVHDITLDDEFSWDCYKEFYGIDSDIPIVVNEDI